MQDSKPLGLILVGDKNIGTLNDSEEGTAEVVKIGERDETWNATHENQWNLISLGTHITYISKKTSLN